MIQALDPVTLSSPRSAGGTSQGTASRRDGGRVELRIDWASLAAAFSDDTAGVQWILHVPTSRLVRAAPEEVGPADFPAGEGYLALDRVRSKQQYRWMVRFIVGLTDRELAAKLAQAIAGKQAFQRFRAALAEHPGRSVQWLDFRAAQLAERIRHWLDVHGLALARPHAVTPGSAPHAAITATRRAQLEGAVDGLSAHELRDLLRLAEFLQANAAARAAALAHE